MQQRSNISRLKNFQDLSDADKEARAALAHLYVTSYSSGAFFSPDFKSINTGNSQQPDTKPCEYPDWLR